MTHKMTPPTHEIRDAVSILLGLTLLVLIGTWIARNECTNGTGATRRGWGSSAAGQYICPTPDTP